MAFALRVPVLSVVISAALCSTAALAQENNPVQPEQTHGLQSVQSVSASQFMVASANPHATEVGYEVLKRGGSAADAAIAVQIMLNLVEPQSSGIGGGAFALHWSAEDQALSTLDGREKAPASATPEYWLNEDGEPKAWWDAVVGGRSVGVPGTLALLKTLHDEQGSLPWAELLQPTIDLAEAGFEISPRLASAIASAKQADRKLDLFEPTRRYFFDESGEPKTAGTVLKNPEFAAALRSIAEQGIEPFYQGEIAQSIVDAVKTPSNAGELTLEDLANYTVESRDPVCMDYRDYEVCGMGPPTSGGIAVGQILSTLANFDLPSMGPSAEAWHLFIEASKLAYADRGRFVADSDFVDVPVDALLNPHYNQRRSMLIDPKRSMGKAPVGVPNLQLAQRFADDTQLERPGTSHLSVVDAKGNMVSMTTTIETGFGSRVMTHGFLLNNELTDFSRVAEKDGLPVANRVEANKRPRSSMSPTIVFKDGEPVLLIGSPGGSRIIGYVAQSLVRILDWGMTPQQAFNQGHVINRNGATDIELGSDAEQYIDALSVMGHDINTRDLNSGLHAILRQEGQYIGGADPRREGRVMGD